jgi:hypothetical protein
MLSSVVATMKQERIAQSRVAGAPLSPGSSLTVE